MLKRELQITFSCKWIWLGAAIAAVLIFVSNFSNLFQGGGVVWIENEAHILRQTPGMIALNLNILNGLKYAYPILCALPAAFIACEEWNGGFARFQFTRTTQTRYMLKKMLACGLCAGLLLTIPVVVTAVSSILSGGWSDPYFMLESPVAEYGTQMTNEYFTNMPNVIGRSVVEKLAPFYQQDPDMYQLDYAYRWTILRQLPMRIFLWGETRIILSVLARAFIAGFSWAMIALAVSAWLPNRYMVMAIPAILTFLISAYVPADGLAQYLYPFYAFTLEFYSLPAVLAVYALRVAFWMILYRFGVERRMRHA